MSVRRRQFMLFGAAALAAPIVARRADAQTPAIVLKLHHFLSPVAYPHTRFLVPWARAVERDSGGRIRIDLFPSMQLGGTAPQLYDQAVNGVADIVLAPLGLTPGRFPRMEVMELPFVAGRTAVVNTRVVQQLYETRLRDEFREVQPICLWAQDQGVLHSIKPVATLEDLKGQRLRSPTRLASEALKALGAVGVSLPVPQIADALARKVIDGCLLPWEVVPAIKLHERVKYHAEMADPPALYTTTFILAMNKARYDKLPPDLRKVIDVHSGLAGALAAARMWDSLTPSIQELARKQGNTITQIDRPEAARWMQATQPVIDGWLKEAKQRKFDGAALLAETRALVTKFGG